MAEIVVEKDLDTNRKIDDMIQSLVTQKKYGDAFTKLEELGREELKDNQRKIELLGVRVSNVMNRYKSKGVQNQTDALVELKNVMESVNPHSIEQGGFLAKLPILGPIFKPALKKVISTISENYGTVQDQISDIRNSIQITMDEILKDSNELKQFHAQIEESVDNLEEVQNFATMLIDKLEVLKDEKIAENAPQNEIDHIDSAIMQASRKARTVAEKLVVNSQSLLTIDTIIKDNVLVHAEMESTSDITQTVMMVGITQSMALERQSNNINGIKKMRDFNNITLKQNAENLATNTENIVRLYNSSVIDLPEFKNNYDKIMKSISKIKNVQSEGYEQMKNDINQMKFMNEQMKRETALLDSNSTIQIER